MPRVQLRAARLGLLLALAGCSGEAVEHAGEAPETLCDFPGARAARLPLLLAEFGTSDAVAVNDHSVYLAQGAGFARVVRVARTGGALSELGASLFYVTLRTSVSDAYLVAEGFAGQGSALYRITRDHELALLDAGLLGANDLAITPRHLYVADGRALSVYRYDRDGKERTTVLETQGRTLLAADGETLYYRTSSNAEGDGALYRLEPDGSSTLLGGGGDSPAALLAERGVVYGAGNGIFAYDSATGLETELSAQPSGIQSLARVGSSLYLTARSSAGDLYRLPLAGGTPELIDSNLGWGGLASDGQAVYYDGGPVALVRCPEVEEP